MRIAVAIATTGRAETVELTAPCWVNQTKPFDRFILSVVGPDDIGPIAAALPAAEILTGPKGLTKQRNKVLDHLGVDCDLIIFADDDFVPSKHYIEETLNIMSARPEIVMLSGWVIADGINSEGISFEDAAKMVAERDAAPKSKTPSMSDMPHAYGCNMIIRVTANPDLRFDERLPLYGWLEDLDYSRRLAPKGQLVRAELVFGVHMGTKRGRQSGVKLGYSQVANPMYFVGKGTMPCGEALVQIFRNLFANAIRTLNPEPWVDRLGRLRGNLLALADALIGRQRPERINEL
jgi:hypothetical protein